MTREELKEYIIRYSGEMGLSGIVLATGETEKFVKSVIREYGLSGHVVTQFDLAVKDLTESKPETYTIKQLADKYHIHPKTMWRRLNGAGLKHLCKCGRARSSYSSRYEIIRLLEQYKGNVLTVSRIAKKRRLTPNSRQGIYNLIQEEGLSW